MHMAGDAGSPARLRLPAEPAANGPVILSATGSLTNATLRVALPAELGSDTLSGRFKVYVLPLDAAGVAGPAVDLGTVAPKDASAAGTLEQPLVFEIPLTLFPPAGDGYQASSARPADAKCGLGGAGACCIVCPLLLPSCLLCLSCSHAPVPPPLLVQARFKVSAVLKNDTELASQAYPATGAIAVGAPCRMAQLLLAGACRAVAWGGGSQAKWPLPVRADQAAASLRCRQAAPCRH